MGNIVPGDRSFASDLTYSGHGLESFVLMNTHPATPGWRKAGLYTSMAGYTQENRLGACRAWVFVARQWEIAVIFSIV